MRGWEHLATSGVLMQTAILYDNILVAVRKLLQTDASHSPHFSASIDLGDTESEKDWGKPVVINNAYLLMQTIGQGSFGKVSLSCSITALCVMFMCSP